MTLLDLESLAATAPGGDVGDGWGVDAPGVVWLRDDSEPAGCDPLVDVRVVAGTAVRFDPEWIDAVVEQASAALDVLQHLDHGELDAASAERVAVGVERLRRQADAAAGAVAGHIDRVEPFRGDGWFTAQRWLKHRLQLSGPEAHARLQAARFGVRVPVWAAAEGAGLVGVAQMRVMAAIAANPRIDGATLDRGARLLLGDAMDRSFEDFERLARTWEMLADPVGAADDAERARQRRHATLRSRSGGGFDLHAVFDDIGGVEFEQVFAHYVQAEFDADWAEATERLGATDVSMSDLRRTQAQRTADALVAMARAAAVAPPFRSRGIPTVNLLIDHDTYRDTIDGKGIDPDRYGDVVCRSEHGHRLHPAEVVNTSLWAQVRRVVFDATSVVIDMGRSVRLFTGHPREAVMLLSERCVWLGCDVPARRCHADHVTSWQARGPTDSCNGAPLCPGHNYLKEMGFRIVRDDQGNWHTYAPEGHEIT